MPKVMPFRGLIFDAGKIGGDYREVCAPPYDVISPGMKSDLHKRSKYNVVRLILGESRDGDTPLDNKYTRSGAALLEWIRDGVLKKDEIETFYVYAQEYDSGGVRHRRVGFIGLMEIEDPDKKTVLPHENTLYGPKKDRMNLIKEVKGNLSPIFGLYSDDDGRVAGSITGAMSAGKPFLDMELNGERHLLWRILDKALTREVSAAMSGKKIFIADGHHRYEVARNYRDAMKSSPEYDGNADYVMMYFCDMSSCDNLTVEATHRVIKNAGSAASDAARRLEGYFHVNEYGDLAALMEYMKGKRGEGHVIGFYSGKKYYSFLMKQGLDIDRIVPENKSAEWKKLDVSILHSFVLKKLLGITGEEGNITYVKDPEEAVSLVREGGHECAFFLNPTPVGQLKAVAEKGDMMPQKSTYFYPKLLSGLVINKFV